jgi:type II secretion system protein H
MIRTGERRQVGWAHGRHGITLVELVMVALIMGMVGAVAIPRFANVLRYRKLDLASRRVMADLRLARMQAIHDSADRKVIFDFAANRYSVPQYAGTADTRTVQFGTGHTEGLTLAGTPGPSLEVVFTRLGVPTAGAATVKVADGTQQAVITVSGTTGRVSRELLPAD